MTKQDVIDQISQRTGQDLITSRAVIESFFTLVKQYLAAGESIRIRGFGSFEPKHRLAKVARNISRNQTLIVPAYTGPSFKPSAEFVNQVKRSEQLPDDK